MAEWTEMFQRDPDLGIMEQAYMKLKNQSMAVFARALLAFADHPPRSEPPASI